MNINDYKNLYFAAKKLQTALDKDRRIYNGRTIAGRYYEFGIAEINGDYMTPVSLQLKSYIKFYDENNKTVRSEWLKFRDESFVGEFIVKAINVHKETIIKTTIRIIREFLSDNLNDVEREQRIIENIKNFTTKSNENENQV